jgi:transposase-like protein
MHATQTLQERSCKVERKWHERHPAKFRIRAVERMNSCDNVLRLARELGLNRSLVYKWRYRLDPANGHAQGEVVMRSTNIQLELSLRVFTKLRTCAATFTGRLTL